MTGSAKRVSLVDGAEVVGAARGACGVDGATRSAGGVDRAVLGAGRRVSGGGEAICGRHGVVGTT
jgi:hypothetical protein